MVPQRYAHGAGCGNARRIRRCHFSDVLSQSLRTRVYEPRALCGQDVSNLLLRNVPCIGDDEEQNDYPPVGAGVPIERELRPAILRYRIHSKGNFRRARFRRPRLSVLEQSRRLRLYSSRRNGRIEVYRYGTRSG